MKRDACINLTVFVLFVLVSGGACMYRPYIPRDKADLADLGVDAFALARLHGEADPRPADPEPAGKLSGNLAVWHYGDFDSDDGYIHPAYSADPTPDEQALKRLGQLDGIDRVDMCRTTMPKAQPGQQPTTHPLQDALAEARKNKADLLLVYTSKDRAKSFDFTLGIGQLLMLGYCPSVIVTSEASVDAVLLDAKTGFAYAVFSGEGDGGTLGIGWNQAATKRDAASSAVQEAVGDALDKLIQAWPAMREAYR